MLSGCAANAPMNSDDLVPFSADEPIEEYVRKFVIWNDEIWGRGACGPANGAGCLEDIVVTASRVMPDVEAASDSITNNQERGVDEGDIVKRIGDHIVLLRRGRLFTLSLPSDQSPLRAVDYIDVAPEGEDIDAWYDEILVHDRTIVLVGYSYDIDAVLIRRFEMAPSGELSAGASYFFAGSDYFDADNYATRLVDGNLIFYLPRELPDGDNKLVAGQIIDGEPANVGSAFSEETVFQPLQQTERPKLHTIANCPLDEDVFRCSATGFIGPAAQLFYISNDAVYLWLNSNGWAYDYFLMNDRYVRRVARLWQETYGDDHDLAVVYRIPIDGSAPGAVKTSGWPMNQFSFRETSDSLQVFTRDTEWDAGANPAVLEIPLQQFSTNVSQLAESAYTSLPQLEGEANTNRFIGNDLFYNDQVEYYDEAIDDYLYRTTLLVKDLEADVPPVRMPLDHLAHRIEPVGDTAVVVGMKNYRPTLGITTIGVSENPLIGTTTWLPLAVEADERSHSFNFRLDPSMHVFGLPVIYLPDESVFDDFDWYYEPNDVHMLYFGLTPDLNLQRLGQLVGQGTEDDDCIVSCVDWYGDSRPFFIADRLYALLGYELVEGYLSGTTVHESARADALSLLRQRGGE